MQCWNYTFFEELVQACEFFWEKDQNSTAAYLVHSSGAWQSKTPALAFLFLPQHIKLTPCPQRFKHIVSFSTTPAALLILRALRASSFHLLPNHSRRRFCFSLLPHFRTRTFVPSNKALIKTASNQDDANKNDLFSSDPISSKSTFFFRKTEQPTRKMTSKGAPETESQNFLQHTIKKWNAEKSDNFPCNTCTFFQIIIFKERIYKQTWKSSHGTEARKSSEKNTLITRGICSVRPPNPNPNARVGFLSARIGLWPLFNI